MIQSIDEQIAFKYSLLLYHLFEYNLLYNLFIIYYIFIYWKRIVNLQKLFQRGNHFFKFKSSPKSPREDKSCTCGIQLCIRW